jgi:GNAT superfamily N-acetyltransferase
LARSASKRNRGSPLRLSVRTAGRKDLDVLVHQRRAMWMDLGIKSKALHAKADRAYRRWAENQLSKRQFTAWVVEASDGRVAGGGCLWLQPVQPSPRRPGTLQPYLLSMYTEPDFRRHGVASMVVGQAIAWCKRSGYKRLQLHASEMGRNVYRRFGFKRTWEMRLNT